MFEEIDDRPLDLPPVKCVIKTKKSRSLRLCAITCLDERFAIHWGLGGLSLASSYEPLENFAIEGRAERVGRSNAKSMLQRHFKHTFSKYLGEVRGNNLKACLHSVGLALREYTNIAYGKSFSDTCIIFQNEMSIDFFQFRPSSFVTYFSEVGLKSKTFIRFSFAKLCLFGIQGNFEKSRNSSKWKIRL